MLTNLSFSGCQGNRFDPVHPQFFVGTDFYGVLATSYCNTIENDATPSSSLLTKEVETYNLVVPDSHTYFVGSERLLSWDATDLQPTFQLVPGLPADILAKK